MVGLSQAKLGIRVDMNQNIICKIENYMYNIRIDTLDRICKGLELKPYELVLQEGEITIQVLLENRFFIKGVVEILYSYYLIMSRKLNTEISEQSFDTYGIALDGGEKLCVEDISTDREFVNSIIKLCNELQLSPIHILDVINDSLTNV